MKLVLVEWVDSFGCSSNWEALGDPKPEPLICQSVGWMAYDGKDCKLIVPHMSKEHTSTPRQGCGDMTIPTKSILRIKTLRG
jgi:hypothetical protein